MNEYEKMDCNKIDNELECSFKKLKNLKKEKINNSNNLIESLSQIIWEQFIIQISGTAGQKFIDNNHNLNLSLKKADHILNIVDFLNHNFPSHNFVYRAEYEKRFQQYNKYFEGENFSKLKRNYRDSYDKNRQRGNNQYSEDHIISVAEIIRDIKAATFLSEEEKIRFANDPAINLKPLDSRANASKGDKSMEDWLNSTRDGKYPDERFNINKEELLENDKKAREEWKKLIEFGEKRAKEEGNKSIRDEIYRTFNITIQSIAIALMAKLTRNLIKEVIVWTMSEDIRLKNLFKRLSRVFMDFLFDFKNNILLSFDVGGTIILTAKFGNVIEVIRKRYLCIKSGGRSLIEVKRYLDNSINKNKDLTVQIMEIGKIVTVGTTEVGGIVLGTTMTNIINKFCPVLSNPLPLIGSPASLLGIFCGSMISGVFGTLILNKINKLLFIKNNEDITEKEIDLQNHIIDLQNIKFEKLKNKYENQISFIFPDMKSHLDNNINNKF